jgi:putative methionine-R-sulfoxide reductase with GAF domain
VKPRRQKGRPPTDASSAWHRHGFSGGRAILERQNVHIRDVDTDPEVARFVRDPGVRSFVALPLLRDGTVIGAIAINAKEPGGLSFSEGWIS